MFRNNEQGQQNVQRKADGPMEFLGSSGLFNQISGGRKAFRQARGGAAGCSSGFANYENFLAPLFPDLLTGPSFNLS